jgi:hypothetical protein
LGNDPDAEFPGGRDALHAGDTLVLLSEGASRAAIAVGLLGAGSLSDSGPSLTSTLIGGSAEQSVSRLRQLLDRSDSAADDLTVLVIKRRRS